MTAANWISVVGILATFAVAVLNVVLTVRNSKRSAFLNTVTTSRLKWIDSLRDKVSEFIAVTVQLLDPDWVSSPQKRDVGALLRERDTLSHKIILHLNPNDPEDARIKELVSSVVAHTQNHRVFSRELNNLLEQLRDATHVYLNKEWKRVKRESHLGAQS